ncbi:hypothetical protein LVB77_14395 [Lysobacter sp. 5GHs7-4]|uniref:tetratricopeptide repeat protein n=1 Tax=Lysobacter sp. 5GHs7-4 TaxID=2904253 RepID=UPI001E4B4D83|nr:hypothetical protein [Lysobacter sp. 5GHs7-4]UHQ21855.1 hypothetical protein LVB77_14395 [Lysobacter sp. 5GHs7-4]
MERPTHARAACLAALRRHAARIAAALLLATLATVSQAGPRTPARDDEVLLRLPPARGQADTRLRLLAAKLERQPRDAAVAAELAELYLGLAARTDDARYYGYAKSALRPWLSAGRLPPSLLRSRIAVRQYYHEFAGAQSDLRQLLAAAPDDSRAWFELALLRLGDGDSAAAARACEAIAGLDAVEAELCLAYLDANGRDLAAGERRLNHLAARIPDTRAGLRRWAWLAAADASARLGRPDQAEAAYRRALPLAPAAHDTLMAYSDFLLERARPREALQLLAAAPDTVAVATRRALALHALKDARALAARRDLAARLRQRVLLGDSPYYPEEIRAQLLLFDDPPAALALAHAQWRLIKSPLAARQLREAAAAAADGVTLAQLNEWLRRNPGAASQAHVSGVAHARG